MPTRHVVKQGESLPEIARKYGFTDHRVVWEAPDNAKLRKRRPDPNVLEPGDVVTIPDPKPKTVQVRTGQTGAFVADATERLLRLVMKDHFHQPLANVPFTLRFKSGPAITGKRTDGSGKIEEPMPAGSDDAYLEIAGRTYHLRFGHLNPMRDTNDGGVSGVQARLKNLGYYAGPTSGTLDDATRVAIALFQSDFGLKADGKPGDATFAQLEKEHGS